MELWADDDDALAAALGYAHGTDRMLQMMLVRLIGQGRLCECLRNDADNLAVDRFAREMAFHRDACAAVSQLTSEARRFAELYSAGVNACLERRGYPWEFRLLGYRPEPWQPVDVLTTYKLMSYVGLAQSQQDAEKFILQAIKAGVDLDRLRALFAPHLDELTAELAEHIRHTAVHQPLLPEAVRFLAAAPTLMASNNWVVAGSRTASGHPIHCNDPHLEGNRLPAVWYEFIAHTRDDFRLGIGMPGVPGLLMGRTRHVSFGFTYGFMDMIDYYIEDVRNGRCRRGDEFEALDVREERIARKRMAPVKMPVWESRHGVLEVEAGTTELADGLYLCRAWSDRQEGAAQGLNALYGAQSAGSVRELQDILCRVTISCNWLMTDSQGNIGYQQSGRLPVRRHSGLFPVPGWDEAYDWQGFAAGDQLSRVTNPPEGFLATANDDWNQEGKPLSINLPMADYRAARIRSVLAGNTACTIEDMKQLQRDLYSRQAERFMPLLRRHIPDTPTGKLLLDWDLCYGKSSQGASLFEAVYGALLDEVFGTGLFGVDVWRELVGETSILTDFYHVFDAALLDDDASWFGAAGRDAVLRDVVHRVMTEYPAPESVPAWGSQRQVMMNHLLFDGRLPNFLGFDYGPVVLEGNRATVVQGAIYRAHGRLTTFCPSYRFITDMGESTAHTVLAGGPSDRRFSPFYTNDVERWQTYAYKTLTAED